MPTNTEQTKKRYGYDAIGTKEKERLLSTTTRRIGSTSSLHEAQRGRGWGGGGSRQRVLHLFVWLLLVKVHVLG